VRVPRWTRLLAIALLSSTAVGHGLSGTPDPALELGAAPAVPNGSVTLSGWRLIVPVAGREGGAADDGARVTFHALTIGP
jgi:hypothetical protein